MSCLWYNLARLGAVGREISLTCERADVAQRQSNRLVSGRLWVRFPSSASACEVGAAGSGRYPSGQRGLTVNQMAYAFGGSNPSLPTGGGLAVGSLERRG